MASTAVAVANRHPVVIVGAGFCGLIALKTCKENGLKAVCFDKLDDIGGLWRFREADLDGTASVMRNTIINTSKEMSAMSDYPPPEDYANFMHNTRIISYLEQYAQKFDIVGDVHFQHEVIGVNRADDFTDTGEWMVHIRRCSDNVDVKEVRRASAVLLCIGHHVYPTVPSFPGQSDFRGKVMHTHSYKNSVALEKKRVLVIGIGNSGSDAATDASFVASQVYLSTRRGSWILQRVGANGVPMDFSTTRLNAMVYKHFRKYSVDRSEKQLNANFDHELYNMKPKHRYDGQHPTMSDTLPTRIIGGSVIVKSDIHRFTEDGVVFKGEESQVYDLDAIIFATGYKIRFPFLENGILEQDQNRVGLYRRIIPPKLAAVHPTLAIIGLVQPIGAIFPIAEMQCRWVVKVLKGEIILPSERNMLNEVKQFDQDQSARYVGSQRHTVQVDFVPYMDMLAEEIGCKPNLIKLFFTDYELFCKVLFGPAVPYQYRLVGPHAWDGARKAILTVTDRMRAPFNTRVSSSEDAASGKSKSNFGWLNWFKTIVLPCIIGIGVYYTIKINPQLIFNGY